MGFNRFVSKISSGYNSRHNPKTKVIVLKFAVQN